MAIYATIEREVLELINQYRVQQNLPALVFNEDAQNVSRMHSQAMAQGMIAFGHDGFQKRAEALLGLLNATGFGENVAYGQISADAVVRSWLNSDAHRKNIEGDYNLTGIAVEKNAQGEPFFTQIFIKSASFVSQPASNASTTQMSVADAENQLMELVQNYRRQKGLSEFMVVASIQNAARKHAQDMAQGKISFGHDGFRERVVPLAQGLNKRNASENVAKGNSGLSAILDSWAKSEGHRKNMEGAFQYSAIGAAQSADGNWFFTQIFIG